jgi:hypothetical protein
MNFQQANDAAMLVILVAEIGAAVILSLGVYGLYIFYRFLRHHR